MGNIIVACFFIDSQCSSTAERSHDGTWSCYGRRPCSSTRSSTVRRRRTASVARLSRTRRELRRSSSPNTRSTRPLLGRRQHADLRPSTPALIVHRNRFTALFRDHPGEPVPEENFWTLWCKGRLTEADIDHPAGRHSIRTNQCPPFTIPPFLQAGCPSCRPTNSVKALKG